MHAERERREIKKITDQEIVQAALESGREIRVELEKDVSIDSLEKIHHVTINFYKDSLEQSPLERQVWEAYQSAWNSGESMNDNIQRDYPDYLFYTYPLLENDSLQGMVSIRLSRKEIILNQ